jgi:hypothetical protein
MKWPDLWKRPPWSVRRIAGMTAFGVVLLGFVIAFALRVTGSPPPEAAPSAAPPPSVPATATAASTGDVCDGGALSAAKYQGTAPHPIAILVKGRTDDSTRISRPVDQPGYSTAKSRFDAWDVTTHPAKAQLVACVDLAGSGSQVKICKLTDPTTESLPLLVGSYQVTLFEAATHKQLLTKRVAGDQRDCPALALIDRDHHLYTTISDRVFVQLFKPYVEKQPANNGA